MRTGAVGSKVNTASVYIFDELQNSNRYGYASSMAFVLFALILLMTLFQIALWEGAYSMVSESAGLAPPAEAPRPPLDAARIGIYAVLFAGVLIAIGPFLWMISASFMTLSEVNLTRLLPENLLWENYATALRRANFLDIEIVTDPATGILQSFGISGYIWNSIRITLITVTGSLLVCIPAAYAFARMNFIGRNFIFALFLSTMMIPGIVMLIPHLLTVIWLGRLSESVFGPAGAWFNNWPALTISLLRLGLQHLPAAAILHPDPR